MTPLQYMVLLGSVVLWLSVVGDDTNALSLSMTSSSPMMMTSTTAGWPTTHAIPDRPGWSWSVGNHRFSIILDDDLPMSVRGDVVAVTVPWRRHDPHPELVDAFIVDARSHLRVTRCTRMPSSAPDENTTFVFEATAGGHAEYHLYYQPFTTCELDDGACRYGANSVYDTATATTGSCADPAGWWGKEPVSTLVVEPIALVRQSRTAFASYGRMETAATAAEVARVVARAAAVVPSVLGQAAAALVFPEDRRWPVRMRNKLPVAWTQRQIADIKSFHGVVRAGERYTLQLAVFAHRANVKVVAVTFSDLTVQSDGTGNYKRPTTAQQAKSPLTRIPASAIHCMNFNGSDYWGRAYVPPQPVVDVPLGQVASLWIAIRVPSSVAPNSTYAGTATVHLQGGVSLPDSQVVLQVAPGPALSDGGDSQPWRGTRLTWLDSQLGVAGDTVPVPYQPLSVTSSSSSASSRSSSSYAAPKSSSSRGGDVSSSDDGSFSATMLDKRIDIGADGLLAGARVGTAAVPGNVENAVAVDLLANPMHLALYLDGDSSPLMLQSRGLTRGPVSNMSVSWSASLTSSFNSSTAASSPSSPSPTATAVSVQVNGTLDCTGYMDYVLSITRPQGARSLAVDLTVPSLPKNAIMAMGLGLKGGYIADMPPPPPPMPPLWLVLDFGRVVEADAVSIFAAGDGIHDPLAMAFEAGQAPSGPWKPVTTMTGAAQTNARQVFKFGDQMTVRSRYWRLLIHSVVPTSMCAPAPTCQADLGEVQLRVGGAWLVNNGTAAAPMVLASSGDSVATMPAWKAADGISDFSESLHHGWDSCIFSQDSAKCYKPLPGPSPPSPPPPSPSAAVVKSWSWDGINGNNAVWTGSSAGGLRLFPKGPEDEWQAGVPFDSRSTPPLPAVWSNAGAGGIRLYRDGSFTAFTGALDLTSAGKTTSSTTTTGATTNTATVPPPIELRFSLMVTPVRPLNLKKHYSERYAQLAGPANYTFIAQEGATVVNMHQGNAINPWINYPYETNTLMKAAADACHAVGLKFKVYNTMRELSNRCREVFAMRSLNETYVTATGPDTPVGRGADWLQEHLQTAYETAWSNPVVNRYPGAPASVPAPRLSAWVDHPREQDAAIKVKALSRWNNYYVEGIRQMVADFGCDGIYLDEIAYDRVTMLRTKKVLGANRLVDHHSDCGGFTPSPASNYLELYPFIDSLWYGEGFNYERASPDYWLLEMSGIPHGLNADLLRYSGMTPQHFKGMLVASANRWQSANDPTNDPFDPRSLWRLWDEFGIANATMYGWWLDRERGNGTVPVTAVTLSVDGESGGAVEAGKRSNSSSAVRVTAYVLHGSRTLLAMGNFADTIVKVMLRVDWNSLGLTAAKAKLVAPSLPPFQTAAEYSISQPISVPAGQGHLLILS